MWGRRHRVSVDNSLTAGWGLSYSNVETTRRDRADERPRRRLTGIYARFVEFEAEVRELIAWLDHYNDLLPHFNTQVLRDDADVKRDRLRDLVDELNHVIRCWRCGAVADVGWFEITTLNDVRPQYLPNADCRTPGCLHWDGTSATAAQPPTPVELRDSANHVMDRFWRRVLT